MALGKKFYESDPNFAAKVYEKNFQGLDTGYAGLNHENWIILRKGNGNSRCSKRLASDVLLGQCRLSRWICTRYAEKRWRNFPD